jgi:hypothetical protein
VIFTVRQTAAFHRLFPNVGSKIITETSSLEDYHALKETSYPTDNFIVAHSAAIATTIGNYFLADNPVASARELPV